MVNQATRAPSGHQRRCSTVYEEAYVVMEHYFTCFWHHVINTCKLNLSCNLSTYCNILLPGLFGGHSHWKVVWGCAILKTPLYQAMFLALEIQYFKPFSSSRDPTFYFLKNFAFSSPNFCWIWLKFSSWDTNFSKNLFLRPQFQTKKSVQETLLLKT